MNSGLFCQLTKTTRPGLGSLFYTMAWELQTVSEAPADLDLFPLPPPFLRKPLCDVICLSSFLSQKAKPGPYMVPLPGPHMVPISSSWVEVKPFPKS